MNDQLLSTFIALVTLDLKIYALTRESQALSKLRVELDAQEILFANEIEKFKLQLHDLKKDVDEKELLMKVFDQQESEKKRRLELISGPKEYALLKAEIASINKQQSAHEQILIDAWDKLDAAQKKYTLEQANYTAKVEALKLKAQELDQKIELLKGALGEQEDQRRALVQAVPAELLDNYEHMRGRVSNPVVEVTNNSCGACFYPVPAQDLAILKKGKFLPCKSCYRILYVQETAGN